MKTNLHKNARTTPALRLVIKKSDLSTNALAKKYNLSWNTVKKWKDADSVEDKSSRPKNIRTTLTQKQEERICFERKQFKKTIDDIFFTLEGDVPNIYPVKIYRCLKRYGLDIIPGEFRDAERKIKKFRRYTIGYIHVDVLYAPKINKHREYIFTAIDRVNKIAFIMFNSNKTKDAGEKFLKKLIDFYPYKINYILSDNGGEFSHNNLPKSKRPKNKLHPFDEVCKKHNIEHRTIKYKHPWTNGMIERFNKTIKYSVLKKITFNSIIHMKYETIGFVNRYNHIKRLRSLNYKTPAQFLFDNYKYLIQRIVS